MSTLVTLLLPALIFLCCVTCRCIMVYQIVSFIHLFIRGMCPSHKNEGSEGRELGEFSHRCTEIVHGFIHNTSRTRTHRHYYVRTYVLCTLLSHIPNSYIQIYTYTYYLLCTCVHAYRYTKHTCMITYMHPCMYIHTPNTYGTYYTCINMCTYVQKTRKHQERKLRFSFDLMHTFSQESCVGVTHVWW